MRFDRSLLRLPRSGAQAKPQNLLRCTEGKVPIRLFEVRTEPFFAPGTARPEKRIPFVCRVAHSASLADCAKMVSVQVFIEPTWGLNRFSLRGTTPRKTDPSPSFELISLARRRTEAEPGVSLSNNGEKWYLSRFFCCFETGVLICVSHAPCTDSGIHHQVS